MKNRGCLPWALPGPAREVTNDRPYWVLALFHCGYVPVTVRVTRPRISSLKGDLDRFPDLIPLLHGLWLIY